MTVLNTWQVLHCALLYDVYQNKVWRNVI